MSLTILQQHFLVFANVTSHFSYLVQFCAKFSKLQIMMPDNTFAFGTCVILLLMHSPTNLILAQQQFPQQGQQPAAGGTGGQFSQFGSQGQQQPQQQPAGQTSQFGQQQPASGQVGQDPNAAGGQTGQQQPGAAAPGGAGAPAPAPGAPGAAPAEPTTPAAGVAPAPAPAAEASPTTTTTTTTTTTAPPTNSAAPGSGPAQIQLPRPNIPWTFPQIPAPPGFGRNPQHGQGQNPNYQVSFVPLGALIFPDLFRGNGGNGNGKPPTR